MQEVREKRGMAYSVYSYFMPMQQPGAFQIGLQTKKEQADEALQTVRTTLRDFIAKGVTEKELRAAKQNIVNGFPLRIDSNKKILEYLSVIGFYELPLSYLDDFTGKVEKVTVAEINAAFKRRVNPDVMATVIVGAPEEKVVVDKVPAQNAPAVNAPVAKAPAAPAAPGQAGAAK
jgi:zinc protease